MKLNTVLLLLFSSKFLIRNVRSGRFFFTKVIEKETSVSKQFINFLRN